MQYLLTLSYWCKITLNTIAATWHVKVLIISTKCVSQIWKQKKVQIIDICFTGEKCIGGRSIYILYCVKTLR